MMVTTVLNTLKTPGTHLVNLVLKSEFGRNGSIYAFDKCYKTSLIKLFNTSCCHESTKKLKDLEGKLIKKDGTVVKLKNNSGHMVSVVNRMNETTAMRLYEAQMLAESQGLNLLKLNTSKGHKLDMYKLITDKELTKLNNDKLKHYWFKSKIGDHDLQYKMKQLLHGLNKKGTIQVSLKFLESDVHEMDAFANKIIECIKQNASPVKITQNQKNNPKCKSYIINKVVTAGGEQKNEAAARGEGTEEQLRD